MSLLFHFILFLIPSPTLLLPQNAVLQSVTQHVSRDTKPQPIKVVISEPCVQAEPSELGGTEEREAELDGDSTVVLTHRIRLVPAVAMAAAGCAGCESDLGALRERIERLEKEVSELREKCGDPDRDCCTSQQSKGMGCATVSPPTQTCPDDCSDQGRCVDGECECFPGFSGPDCSSSNCPGNCRGKGKCVSGECVCDPGFTGPDCSEIKCPRNCSLRGTCVNGACACETGFTGPDCSVKACPRNCSQRGTCVNGKCVCETGFTGLACTAMACPGNCNKRGRCMNGKCVCDTGFTGPNCSEKSCPGNCNNRGTCVKGKCVCETGFSGPDCSEKSCPGNCNNRGRCINGKCVCKTGFTGPDCSEKSCPGNCNNRGRCVNGQCVCETGFTGPDCYEKSCPGNCNSRGQCVNGQCLCETGFAGPDCSTKTCPSDCNNRGKCVNGRCVCATGFAGVDCSSESCPADCSGRGQCVNGRCVCQRGSAGPDCSQCEDGFTGVDCTTVLSGVSNLSTRDITESSVTLFWTQPAVQYDTYYITFTSEKETDQKIVTTVSGRMTSHTQIGLAPGQHYTVTITGEKDGQAGTGSQVQFQTLIAGPKNLQLVKTSTTSITIQWEQAQGEIDRYLLFVSPNQTDKSGKKAQEVRLTPERDSAQIDSLEPGQMYDISVVAERDGTRSQPVTVQATPGTSTKPIPKMTEKTATTQVALETDHSDSKTHETQPNRTDLLLKNQGEEETGQRKPINVQGLRTSEGFRKPRVDMPRQGRPTLDGKVKVLPRPGSPPGVIRKPNTAVRFNGTKPGSGGGKLGHFPSQKLVGRFSFQGPRRNTPSVGSGLQYPITKDNIVALTLKETSQESTSRESVNGSYPGTKSGHSKMEPDGQVLQNITQGSQPISISEEQTDSTSDSELYRNISELTEEPLAPTITTEKNLTAYINGTKCVRKVLVGRRQIHLNGTMNRTALTKNMTVTISHINGNEILQKILTGKPEGVTHDVIPLTEEGAKLHGEKNKQKPSLHELGEKQEEETGEAKEEDGVMRRGWSNERMESFLTTSHPTKTSSQQPTKVSTQEGKSGTSLPQVHPLAYSMTSPSPPLPTPPSKLALVPSATQGKNRNNDQLLKDRHPTRTSFQMSPSFRHRFTDRSKSPGSSAPRTKGRHTSRPTSSVMSQISTDRRPDKNGPSVPLTHPSAVEQETVELEALLSGEPHPDDQGSLTTSVRRASTPPPSAKVPVTVSSTYTGKMKGEHEKAMPETERTETKDRKVPPFRRVPIRGVFPHQPNIRPFQNQTRPLLKVPQQPYRSRVVRPIPPTVTITGNITASKIIPHHQKETEMNNTGLNGPSPNFSSSFTVRRKNGIIIRFPPRFRTQITPNATMVHRGPKDSRHETKSNLISQAGLAAENDANKESTADLPADKDKDSKVILSAERTTTDDDIGGSAINGIMNRVTNRHNGSAVITHPQAESKVSITSRNGLNLTMRRKNGTSLRFPPRLWTQIKPNTSTIYTGPKGSKDSKAEKGSKADHFTYTDSSKPGLSIDKESRKDSKPGLSADKDSSKDSKLGLSVDKDSSKDSKPGLSKEKDSSKDSNMPLLTGKVTSKYSKVALSTDKAGIKNDKTFVFSGSSEDSIDHIAIHNVTSKGFTIIWGAPVGIFQNFIISLTELGGENAGKTELRTEDKDGLTSDKDVNMGDDRSQDVGQEQTDPKKGHVDEEEANALWTPPDSHTVRRNSSDGGGVKKLLKVLPGSARLYLVTDLTPQTAYSVSLFGKGPGSHSKIHHFIVSTGPEPPTNLAFTEVSESSVTVSWTRPKSPVSGFKVTYMHTKDGEPASVAVSSADSSLTLSQLSPGSSYEISVISVRGLDESDAIRDVVITLPDPPTDLDAINITDTKALLLWRPALSTVDQYVIVYGSEEAPGSEMTIQVSGNAAEQQLQALRSSTRYTVSISSQLGDIRSSNRATTTFTTASGSKGKGEGPRDLRASQVTPRTAVLSWKPPASAVMGYKLTYFTEGQEMKELLLGPGVIQHKLRGLHAGSVYTAQLQAERKGVYTITVSTHFTTGFLRFPFPTDCTQELLNGEKESGVVEIFPGGEEAESVLVYCDMDTDGGGWTVFQRRKDGKVNFFKGWKDYRKGFGDLEGEFWLGNDILHNLTSKTPMTLRVDLRSGAESVYAQYSTFTMDTAKKHYTLHVSGYSGTAGDSMKYHDRRPFSTWDRDPQPFITRCAMSYRGGWWYKNCHEANLNGLYNTHTNHQGLIWTAWKGTDFSIPFSEMKLRPTSFNPNIQT